MTLLTQNTSTHSGADLWILPETERSRAAKKMDWYLNFQLSLSQTHQPIKQKEELLSLVERCGLENQNFASQAPQRLLVSSAHLLPNRWVVQIEFRELKNWCQQIAEVWTSLRKPSLRIFLPTGLSAGDFDVAWKQEQSFDDFALVVD